jgi:hypothetical protein
MPNPVRGSNILLFCVVELIGALLGAGIGSRFGLSDAGFALGLVAGGLAFFALSALAEKSG